MFGRGVPFIGKCPHAFHAQKFLCVDCHGRECVCIVYGARVVVDEEFVFCITPCLHVIAHIDYVAVQHYRSGIGIGKADLSFPAGPQLFFYVPVLFLFGLLVYYFVLYPLDVEIRVPGIELVLVF
jgi:hypothetical protein